MASGAQASFLVATVPANASGTRLEIFGRDGTLVVTAGSLNQGPSRIIGARGKEPLEPMDTPHRFRLVSGDVPPGPPLNVAQAYVRFAASVSQGQPFQPDFEHAVTRHALIDAIERSDAQGHAVRIEGSKVASSAKPVP